MNSRRQFIKNVVVTTAGSAILTPLLSIADNPFVHLQRGQTPRHILLRSGWQVENIGDIAHTPAILALLEKYVPDAKVTFWPWYHYLPDNERHMLIHRFPNLSIVEGNLDDSGKASSTALQEAINSADFFLHNSGPSTIAWADADRFKKLTGNEFGVYGVSFGLYGTPEVNTLSRAAFTYFRDSISLNKAREAGVNSPIMGFSPDVAFAIDVTDEEKARNFLSSNGLKDGEFLCCIPKHRNTPVWLHPLKKKPFDPVKNERNEAMKEHDHEPLRRAITAVIRTTNLKILICHEDETQIIIGKQWLLDHLPADVKPRVVWLDRPWLTDEANSVYKRAAGFFGSEMHSPIMCIANGIPAIVVRWAEQSTKGFMWDDIGLKDWLFDFDNENDIQRFVPTVLHMANHLKASKIKALKAREYARNQQAKTMLMVEKFSRHKT